MELILSSLYLILPAYIANMCPALAQTLRLPMGTPVSEKYFGSHKTWRGFYSAYLGALLTLYLQKELGSTPYDLLQYEIINIFLYAFLFGIGAAFGDLIKSFFKRRMGIKPGRPWIPFDQLDFVIGALLFLSPFHLSSWSNILVIIVITPILHFLTNLLAYILGLKKVWW